MGREFRFAHEGFEGRRALSRCHDRSVDLSLERIEAAVDRIPAVFQNTPQLVDEQLSEMAGCEVVVKVETLNPIGSFKGRGTWLLADKLDPCQTWVCATAGNFGQGVAYAGRARGASVQVFMEADVPEQKVERMRRLGATVELSEDSGASALDFASASGDRVLVKDGLDPAVAEGAGTIGLELAAAGPIGTVLVQVGDGALITGVARAIKARSPGTRVVGVCASGAPAMAQSFEAGRPISAEGDTIATALSITHPVPESLSRIRELVDEIVLVDDDELRSAMRLVAETMGLLVEPAGAAGVAALRKDGAGARDGRVAVLLTGAGYPG